MLEGHGTSYGGERGKEKEDPVGIWKRLLLVPSRFTLANRTNDTRRDVHLENFHLLLSSPPRWQDERNALGRNLCLISISGIPSTSLSFASYLVSEQTKNRTIKESYRTRSFCHERYTISSDIILHAVYFTRCWVSCSSKSRKDFISGVPLPVRWRTLEWGEFFPWKGSCTEIRSIDPPVFLNNARINPFLPLS